MPKHISRSDWRACGLAGWLIGMAIAGFLDGILLHQSCNGTAFSAH